MIVVSIQGMGVGMLALGCKMGVNQDCSMPRYKLAQRVQKFTAYRGKVCLALDGVCIRTCVLAHNPVSGNTTQPPGALAACLCLLSAT
jgi:hypothetical protein